MFNQGDRVHIPNPSGDGTVEATFLRRGDPDDAIEVDGHRVDVGWVRYEDGSTAKVRYSDIKPV
jgi:hypothetical protein